MGDAPRILAVSTAVPRHRWSQAETLDVLAEHYPLYRDRRVQRIVRDASIETRHFAIAPDEFDPAADAAWLHRHFEHHSLELGARAARAALDKAGMEPTDVDAVIVATCTGYLCPGLTARLGAQLGLRDDVQRADLVGMGCAGAMPALQRARDFACAHPGRRALVVCVEISSACFHVDDSLETVVGNTICADGAAAVIVGAAADGRSPALERFSTLTDPAFLASVGLEFVDGRQRIVLSKDLRHAAGPLVRRGVERLLDEARLGFEDVDHWIVHSGGRRVLDGIDRALALPPQALANSRAVLRGYGNMSSPTLLFVMSRVLESAGAGDVGVAVALGPGLAVESGVLRW